MLLKSREQRLGHGLPGYLIPFATHAFVFQRQKCASELPSLSVFPMISTDFTPTPAVLLASDSLKLCRFQCIFAIELRALTLD